MDRKEYQKEWIRKKRDKGKVLTLEIAKEIERGSTKGSTYDFKVPERAKVLPPDVINRILACLRERANKVFGMKHALPDDSEARWDRAITYHNWRLAYKLVLIPLTDWYRS